MKIYRIAFIGHCEISEKHRLEDPLDGIIKEMLHEKEFVELYVGCDGDFDILASVSAKMVQRAKGNQNSRLVLVKAYPSKDDDFYERFYDEVRYPIDWKTNPQAARTKRNRWIANHADLLVAFVEPDRNDGAAETLKYAEKKGVKIINLAI